MSIVYYIVFLFYFNSIPLSFYGFVVSRESIESKEYPEFVLYEYEQKKTTVHNNFFVVIGFFLLFWFRSNCSERNGHYFKF